MAPARWLARPRRALTLLSIAILASPGPAHALRVVNWNILNYPASSSGTRNPHYRTVLSPLAADVVVVQEMQSQAGVDNFLANVLNTLQPGQWSAALFTNGTDTDNAIFYRPTRVNFLGQRAFYVSSDVERLVNEYRLRPVGYSVDGADFYVYSVHLKASNTGPDAAQRLREATGLRDTMNALLPGAHAIVMGDFNIYSGAEGAFGKFLESQADNDGRVYDPLGAPLSTWNVAGLAPIHTQSTSLGTHPFGGASGGLDDRFDMFLPTYPFNDGEGLDIVPGTYVPVGNDGLHYNLNITDSPTIPEGAAYASALLNTSDHMPIRIDLQIPAKISVPASLAFGRVIVGGAGNLTVTNPALPPADELTLSFAPPAGFTAPANGTVDVGASTPFAIGTADGAPGPRSGNLTLTTDDPDNPVEVVALSADVLEHAEASLDSLVVLLADTLDFGTHATGSFGTQLTRVHNRGWHGLQAFLELLGGTITGPAASRFSILEGPVRSLIMETGARRTIAFDDTGAPADSTYRATLTLTSQEEQVPGAAAQPDLVLTLLARISSGAAGTPPPGAPSTTRLYAPFPNPLAGSSTVRFDLALPGDVELAVFDLGGRRTATLARGALEPGRHTFGWDGRGDDGRVATAGLYFVRLSGRGVAPQSARLAVIR